MQKEMHETKQTTKALHLRSEKKCHNEQKLIAAQKQVQKSKKYYRGRYKHRAKIQDCDKPL